MYFSRFDIVEAWYLALCHCYSGQWTREYSRMCAIQKYFTPGAMFGVNSLTENGREIYDAACRKLLAERYPTINLQEV